MTDEVYEAGKTRVEGGIDAIVIGDTPDGLVAAAYLARSGLKTVLLEGATKTDGPPRPSMRDDDRVLMGEHLFHAVDPQAIEDLDLYGCGLAYAARRAGVTYFFEDGESLTLGGDLRAAAQDAEPDGDAFMGFITDAFEASAFLRPLFAGPPGVNGAINAALTAASPRLAKLIERWLTQSAEAVVGDYFPEGAVKTAMLAEAAFRNGAPLHEPMSLSPLLARWSGEIAGLQGAVAYAAGGAGAAVAALRRAAQKAKVEFRKAGSVARILIEKDRAAGVEFETGNQLRAPIVIAATDAETTYTKLIGPASLDRTFQRTISMRKPAISTAHLRLSMNEAPVDLSAPRDLRRRLVYAPARERVVRAFVDAANGDVPSAMIVEAVFEDAFDEDGAGGRRLSVLAHPAPQIRIDDEARRDALRDSILAALARIVPDIRSRIDSEDLMTAADLGAAGGALPGAYAACEGVYRQLARAASVTSAGMIGGLFFCGPEAQIGYGVNGAAGRNAAQTALKTNVRAAA